MHAGRGTADAARRALLPHLRETATAIEADLSAGAVQQDHAARPLLIAGAGHRNRFVTRWSLTRLPPPSKV